MIDDNINLYPNPTSGKVTLIHSGSYRLDILSIHNLQGGKINMESNIFECNGPVQYLDFSNIPNGVWVMRHHD